MKKFLLVPVLFLAACEPVVGNGAAVRVADATNVWRCKAIGETTGETRHGLGSPNGLALARRDAMNAAAAMGGDTIVWKSGATGVVYNCH